MNESIIEEGSEPRKVKDATFWEIKYRKSSSKNSKLNKEMQAMTKKVGELNRAYDDLVSTLREDNNKMKLLLQSNDCLTKEYLNSKICVLIKEVDRLRSERDSQWEIKQVYSVISQKDKDMLFEKAINDIQEIKRKIENKNNTALPTDS